MRTFFAFLLLAPTWSLAQTGSPVSVAPAWYDDPMTQFYLLAGSLLVVALVVLLVAVVMLHVINVLAHLEAKRKAEERGEVYRPAPSFWSRFWQSANEFVPVEKEKDILLDHNYDGIRELDNHLPPWWKWLFYGTIAFSLVYLIVYHVTLTLPSSEQEYQAQVAEAEEQIKIFRAKNPVDENTVTLLTDAAALAEGQQLFQANCASCHLADGGGDIGPNLTDKFWIHGGGIKEVFTIVKNGVPGTNMVAWGQVLSPQNIQSVSSYVLSLQGTTPVKAKAPQGTLYPPDSTQTQTDTLNVQTLLR
ncbi:MAG: c-type cytochrome [Cyclobacteriaceae bacterium]|jgi:cytochrome c oxidase cbb3-type subunit 3|nr:c-type cytochrome [Cyclobacteriaceae bacterium]